MNIKLLRPELHLKDSFLGKLKEMTVESDRAAWVYLNAKVFPHDCEAHSEDYAKVLNQLETTPPQGLVPDSVCWACAGPEVVGRISLRHELNDFLREVGGHIGYIVAPSARGRGVASEMLRQMLELPRARSIGRLLLTCDADNLASEMTILKNGGVLERTLAASPPRPAKKHYWISV